MENSIFNLLYVSRVAASAAASLNETMHAILLVSDANNRRDGITGFLLSDGYAFVQFLEGAEAQVRDCYARICADDRTFPPTIREVGHLNERLFPDWSMCGLNLSGRDNVLLKPGQLGFDLFEASPGALRQHLLTLVQIHGADLLRAHAPLFGKTRQS